MLILRSLASFESLYLSRSASRLTEVVNTATSGGSRNPPGATEGITVARIALNELDSGRFDPLLLRSVARGVGSSLDAFATRLENLVRLIFLPFPLANFNRDLTRSASTLALFRSPRTPVPTSSTGLRPTAPRRSTPRSSALSGNVTL